MVRQEKQPSRNRMKRNPMRMIREEPETDEFDSLMEDDEDFGEEDGYEDEDDLLKGMDFLNDIDNAETMEIPVREVKKSKPAKKSKKPVSEEEEMEQLIDSMQPKKNAEDIIPREKSTYRG